MGMLKTVSQAFKVPEMRNKIIFTVLMLIVFRLGSSIPVPFIDRAELARLMSGNGNGLMEMFDLFSGKNFSNLTIFALSITPYITASIIVQLLTVAFPYFENLAKEGTTGRKKMAAITRYLTVVLALIQATGMTFGLFRSAVVNSSWYTFGIIILVLTAGTAFLMWLGEQINENGVGNGISLLIFAGIIVRLPSAIIAILTQYLEGTFSIISLIIFALFALVVVAGIIMIQQGTRKIPVQYAKRVVGRKMYGGQSTHIPLKVNQAGVIPVIFAMSIVMAPYTITQFFAPGSDAARFIVKWFMPMGNPGVWFYSIANIILIIAFNYFYTTITFNPVEIAQNMKSNGGFIPGTRPGRATIEYLSRVMGRLSLVGAIFLAIIATLPTLVSQYTGLEIRFGGTAILIAVGVAIDVMRQIDNQMMMRSYKGFLK